jgi:hypothetical protein
MSMIVLTDEIVQSGSEPIIAEAIAYLERLGIPRVDIRALTIEAEVGDVITITPTLYVRKERPQLSGSVKCPLCTATSQSLSEHMVDYHLDRVRKS